MSFRNAIIRGIGCDPRTYHARNEVQRGDAAYFMSPSSLKEFAWCPSRWRAGYAAPESDAKEWGSLLDTLVLTPEILLERYRVRPATYKNEKGEEKPWNNNANVCKAWNDETEAAGLEVVKPDDFAEVRKAAARLGADEILAAFSRASDKQVWVTGDWLDEATGLVIPVQCLIDYAPKADTEFAACLGDLKSTRSAMPHVWESYSRQRAYNVQAAFDLDLFNAATGEARDTWCFVLSENYPPYETGRMILELKKAEFGRLIYQAWLTRYSQCLKTGIWGGYQDNAEAKQYQGWSLDKAGKWDEMEAFRAMEGVAPADAETPPVDEELLDHRA